MLTHTSKIQPQVILQGNYFITFLLRGSKKNTIMFSLFFLLKKQTKYTNQIPLIATYAWPVLHAVL